MNQALQARAEVLKLARLLHAPADRLDYLEPVAPEDIRALRDQVTELLFSAHDGTLRRLAGAGGLLPVALVALIAERAFGPVMAARIAGLLDPSRAVEVAAKLPVAFLADVAIELDPRRATPVISGIRPQQVAEITRELARRREFVTMGRFVGHLPTETLRAAVAVLDDGDTLRTAFVMEDKDRLDELVEVLGEERVERLVNAARSEGLWVEVIDLIGHLGHERRVALVAQASSRQEEILDALLLAAAENGLWRGLMPLVELLDDELKQRVATITASLELEDESLAELVEAMAEHEAGLELLGSLDEELKLRLVEPLERMDPRRRAGIARQARKAGVLDQMGPLRPILAE